MKEYYINKIEDLKNKYLKNKLKYENTPTALSGFTYELGEVPSTSQSYTVFHPYIYPKINKIKTNKSFLYKIIKSWYEL